MTQDWMQYAHDLNEEGVKSYSVGQFDEALAAFDRALALNPTFTEALNNRGATYRRLLRFAESIADHRLALEISPCYAHAWFNLGKTYLAELFLFCRANRVSDTFDALEMLKSFEKALECDPDDADARAELSKLRDEYGIYRRNGRVTVPSRLKSISPLMSSMWSRNTGEIEWVA